MDNLLLFLDGRKLYILAILSALNSFMVASNFYNASVGALVQTIISILGGGATLATDSAVKNETPLGRRIVEQRTK